jgi:glycosyltransferase involved in cell wall biosynthesis
VIANSPVVRQQEITPGRALAVKPSLHVLQVFSVLGMGGAETWLLSLLKYFKEHSDDLEVDVKFDILLTGGERAVFDDEAERLGAKLVYLPFTRRTLAQFTKEFRRLLAENHYDVIHDHQDYVAGLHFLLGGKYLPPKRVVHVHNPLLHIENYRRSKLRTLTSLSGQRLVRTLSTDILGTSAQVLTEYGFTAECFPEAHIGAAHCGFEVDRFRGDAETARVNILSEFRLPETAKLLLFVGRLDSSLDPKLNQKNPAFAVEVAKACVDRNRNCYLLMAGGGGEEIRSELRARMRSHGLEQNALILGMRSDVPKLMLGSHLLLLPSLAEGLGMVAVEAQATGLRVLTSTATPKECVVVKDLVTFKSLQDGAQAWAEEALSQLDQPRMNSLVANRAVEASPFSIENSARRLLQVYSS